MTSLRIEIETYNRALEQLLPAQAGKFVLIKGDEVVDTFDTYEDALKCGYGKFGLQQFFVKEIAPPEQLAYFTRDFTECRV